MSAVQQLSPTGYGLGPGESRLEKIDRNLFRDWGSAGGPYVVQWKLRGKPKRRVLGVLSSDRLARAERDKVMGTKTRMRATTKKHVMLDLREAYWNDCQASHADKPWKPATVRKYDQKYEAYIADYLPDHLRLSDIDAEAHLEPMLENMYAKLAVKTVLQTWAIVTGMLSYAVENEWLEVSPAVRVRKRLRPTVKATRRSKELNAEKVITVDGLTGILSSFRNGGNWTTMIKIGFKLGLRPSEVLGLCRDQIEDGYLTVDRQLADQATLKAGDPTTWLVPAKNEPYVNGTFEKGRGRKIRLQPDVAQLIREHLIGQRWVSNPHPDGWVLLFPTYNGTPHFQTTLADQFSWALDQAGLATKPWTFHCLRHTYATDRFQNGATYFDVADELGDTPEVVKETYVHFVNREYREKIAAEQWARSALSQL